MSTLSRSRAAVDAHDRTSAAGERRLLRSAVVYATANVLSSAIPFVLLPVLTRVLSPADFGMVAMFSVVQVILLPLTGLSTKHAVAAHFFSPGGGDVTRFLTTCLILTAVSSASVALLLLPFRAVLVSITQLPAGWLWVALVAAAAQFVILLTLALWQARGNAVRFGVFQVLQIATNVGLSLLFVLSLGLGWEGRVLGQVGSLVLFAALGVLLLWLRSDLGWPPRADHAREALAFGLPLVPHGLTLAVAMVADRFLVSGMLSVEQTGLYTAALQISMVLTLAVQAFNRAYQPWLLGGLQLDSPAFRRRAVQGSYLYFLFLAAAAAVIGLAAPLIVDILLGEQFHPAAAFIPFLAFGVAFDGMYNVVANYLILSRRTAWLSFANMTAAALHIAAGVLLIRRNGTVGAAQAFVLAQAILFLFTWWLACRAYAMPWRSAFGLPRA
jgi:O-antigen/teichoic acid export membrane protein